jgi:hypothetical protein
MKNIIRVRLLLCCSLIFSFTAISCRDEAPKEIILGWEDKQVKAIMIPEHLLDGLSIDSVEENLHVMLAEPGAPPIIGEYSSLKDFIVFAPAIPFTTGKKYLVLYKDRKLQEITIPARPDKAAPEVTAVFPSEDSLPENLLKIYISFSERMQEGVSGEYIFLIKDGKDTLKNVFLDLQPELWNYQRNMLTLWLNPGRIKRDLIPNREEGPPLIPGAHYQVCIKPGWRNAYGDSMEKPYQKDFVTAIRDTVSPNMDNWTIKTPASGTLDPLLVNFNEPLDFMVVKGAVSITDGSATNLTGSIEITGDEKTLRFVPDNPWKAGKYNLRVEARVEDLAGNRLDRLFDRDLAKPGAPPPKVNLEYPKEFEIR